MDKTIDITIKGSYLRKNNNSAGVQGEANVTILHIIFDNAWEGLAKSVTFWNSRGENPVKRTLTNDLLVDINVSLLEYNVPIPSEPLEFAGDMTFVIDGYLDGKRKRSMQDTLSVEAALMTDTENEPSDPTPTQAEQLQTAIEAILPAVQEESQKATAAAEEAIAAAETIGNKAEIATQASEQAKLSEENAKTSEINAKASEERAVRAETEVLAVKDIAISSAEQGAEAVRVSREAKETAVTKASEALLSAERAYASEVNAKVSEASAEADALLSKSYAVGGTGVREGEATDNAKYYYEQTKGTAGGDFVTNSAFNTFIETSFNPLAQEVSENSDSIADVNDKIKNVPTAEEKAVWENKVGMVNNKTGVAVTLTASDVGAVDTGTFTTTVENINTAVNSIGNRTTTLETTINSLINGEAVQY